MDGKERCIKDKGALFEIFRNFDSMNFVSPICASHSHKSKKRREHRNHDMPLGGKVEACLPPSFKSRINFIMLRPDQCPFQCFNARSTSPSLRSGSQNPVLNSLSSASVRCLRASSRRLGGRPFRRSCWSWAISSSSRLMHLECGSLKSVGSAGMHILGNQLGQFGVGHGLIHFLHNIMEVLHPFHWLIIRKLGQSTSSVS